MTSKVSDCLKEFAGNPECDQAKVLNYLGREVTKLTSADLPALQEISKIFTNDELNYYIDHIKQGETAYPYWIEKLKHLPVSEKEREAYLQELFAVPVLNMDTIDSELCSRIVEGLKSCGIKDQVLLAKIITYFSQGWVVSYAERLDINDIQALRMLGMAAANQADGNFIATAFLKKFPVFDEAYRLELAKLGLEAKPTTFCHNLVGFGLKEQASFDELALLCSKSQEASFHLLKAFSKFGKLNKQIAKEIIKNCIKAAYINVYTVLESLNSYNMLDLADKKEIGLLCVRRAPDRVGRIANFDKNDKRFIKELCKISLEKEYVYDLYITIVNELDLPAKIELFCLGLTRFPNALGEAEAYQIPGAGEWKKLRSEVEIEFDAAFQAFKQLVAKELPGFSFEKEFGKIEGIKDPYAKEQSLIFLIEMVGLTRVLLTEEERKWVVDNGFAAALLSMPNPTLRTLYLGQLMQQAKNPALRAQFAGLPGNEKVPWVLLTRVLYADLLNKQGVEAADIQAFREKVEKGVFIEDNKKAAILMDTLYKLSASGQVKAVLQRIVAQSKTSRQTYENICAVRNIFDLKMEGSLLREVPLMQILQQAFKEVIPFGDINDFTNKLTQKFLTTRQPNALITYIAKMKTLNDPNVLTCLGEYIESVLNGTFPEIRYRTANNSHLAQVANLLDAWKVNVARELPVDEATTTIVLEPTVDWLTTKLIKDKHIDPLKIPHLIAFLQNKPEEPVSPLEIELVKLCRTDDLKEQMKVLQGIRGIVHEIPVFENDIKSRILEIKRSLQPQEPKKYILVNTDDPIDLLNCGTESPGSCQDVNGSPSLNKGLLGYLMDGKIRLIAVKDAKSGVIAARTMMKLLLNQKGEPVILLERIYGNKTHVNALVALAKETAARLGGIPVVFKPEGAVGEPVAGDPYPGDIVALGGPAPFEYSDAARNCCANGKYTVKDARFLL